MTAEWVLRQVSAFLALEGQAVHSWRGTEMCVRGGADGVPAVFGDPEVPCLQLWVLHARTDGPTLAVGTYPSDDICGLWVRPDPEPLHDEADGILRTRDLTELPTGLVEKVEVFLERGEIAEVALRVGEHELLLLAGESYENWTGDVTWVRLDESVLVFTDPAQVAAAKWSTPRDPRNLRRATR